MGCLDLLTATAALQPWCLAGHAVVEEGLEGLDHVGLTHPVCLLQECPSLGVLVLPDLVRVVLACTLDERQTVVCECPVKQGLTTWQLGGHQLLELRG